MLKKEKLHLCCWGTYTLRGPILSPWRPKSVPISSQFLFAVSRLAGQTAQAEAPAAGQKPVTVYIDLHYQWSGALVWDCLVGEEYLSKTDPMRLGSEQLSEDHAATAPPSPNNCFSSYDTSHWSQIALFCIAAHVRVRCCITLQLLYLLFSVPAASEVVPFWWVMTWLQLIMLVSSLWWAAAAQCRQWGSCQFLGKLLKSWWVCVNMAATLSNLNFTFLLLSATFPKILSWLLDFQICHLCTLWFMLTTGLPKTSLWRSLFQHHGSFPEQDSLEWEAGPLPCSSFCTSSSTAFTLHHLVLQM